MRRYLMQASYTAEAAAAFVSKPQDRVAGVRTLIEAMGGKLELFEFCFGEYDLVAIAALPDDVAAAAAALRATGAGHLKAYKTTPLLTAEEFMAAQEKAHGVSFQPPSLG